MKSKLLVFCVIATLISVTSYAQKKNFQRPNPIPSFNFLMNGQEAFEDLNNSGNFKERRELNIQTSTASHGITTNIAKVWVVKKNEAKILGPYYLDDGELLVVPVDNGKWGAVIESQIEVVVDIWFTPR